MNRLFLIVLILALSFQALSKTHFGDLYLTTADTTLLGKYHAGASDIGSDLILNHDGTFVWSKYFYTDVIIENDDQQEIGSLKIYYGIFSFRNRTVFLTPKVIVKRSVLKSKQVLKDSMAYYKSDSTALPEKFSFIKWNKNIYLLSAGLFENDFIEFANDYNSGYMPGLTPYFTKRWNNNKPESFDVNQFPKKWRAYILDIPVQASVTKISDHHKHTRYREYQVNVGRRHGIRKGMILYGKNCCSLRIVNVKRTSATGIIALCPFNQDACKIGDVLGSRAEQK